MEGAQGQFTYFCRRRHPDQGGSPLAAWPRSAGRLLSIPQGSGRAFGPRERNTTLPNCVIDRAANSWPPPPAIFF
jgi:hypothetical protein